MAAIRFLIAAAIAHACFAASPDCAPCHRAIYEQYRKTPMANSSGEIGRGSIRETLPQSFDHVATGFRYRVERTPSAITLEFARRDGALKGTRELHYFVGSGATARSYLLEDGGFLYQAPIAYYTSAARWDLAPNYETYAYPYLTRPVMPGCLTCHASFLKPVPITQNRYGSPPFAEGGIACERCHGPGEEHIRRMKTGDLKGGLAVVNPAKLDAERRDSVCWQCHLAGEVRVFRPGRDWSSYGPPERLADSISVFVRTGTTPGMKVASHAEQLAQSACKRASADRLWCGTCHDPHAIPGANERAARFRRKCLGCHDAGSCRETQAARAARGDDCAGCHMTKNPATDAQHVVYTDHSIPKRPRPAAAPPSGPLELALFGGGTASARDLALAYGIAASRTQDAALRSRATALLEDGERASPEDVEILLYLAELYRNANRYDEAVPLYRRAIGLDRAQVTASVGLGGILVERGEFAEAIRLWQDALSKNGGLELVRINLAMAQWRSGDLRAAESTMADAVRLNPGFATPADLLKRLREQLAK